MEEIKFFSPASVANVSCGFDVLGFCLDPIGDEMVVRRTVAPGVKISKIEGQDLPFDVKKNVAGVAAEALLKEFPVDFGFEIEIYKKIKAGSGIGSSAASAAGSVYGINELLGRPFTAHELVSFAMEGESVACGAAHADNVAPVLLGGITLVRSTAPLEVIKLPSPSELTAVILHPKIELKTLHAREILKKNVSMEKAVQQWGNLGAFVSALYQEDYELMSRSLKDGIVEPMRSLLIPNFENLKKASKDAGAIGFGISGSGPSVFALTQGLKTAKEVAEALKKNISSIGIDFELHISNINNQGIKVIAD
ncbi:MAG: homoserine kinase [Flavobacteriaceae bacterium]|jgi:homoserine kinase|nr:homoserine kinase [Flavobacteriaceae bacterium]MDG1968543.1 homoserine kinase [Flavobacteriaceae bacterium]|tara:strand:- start:834 stop:1760 length:927 start_codon:yes stop_codon:yes gene_type:complete